MRFAFARRVTTEATILVEAETETEAWAHALDETGKIQTGDERVLRKPIVTRAPKFDEFDL